MICEEILNNLSEIIENSRNNDIVSTIFNFAKKVIQDNEIIMKEQPDINEEANQLMATSIFRLFFRKDKTGYISLSFGHKYLDTYHKNSTTHYVLLIHELKHVYDYYSNKDTFFNLPPKERLYYEIEARKIEHLFIKNYLVGKYQLTKHDEYILSSYENDDLEAYNITIQKESSKMFQFILDLEADYKNNKITTQQLVDKIIQKTDPLLEKSKTFFTIISVYQQNDNNFQYYADFTRLKTFLKYFDMVIEPFLKDYSNIDLQNRIGHIRMLIQKHDHPNHIYSLSLENYFENVIIS
jgi:hypothetical protein